MTRDSDITRVRVSMDIGGTFTDIVTYDERTTSGWNASLGI